MNVIISFNNYPHHRIDTMTSRYMRKKLSENETTNENKSTTIQLHFKSQSETNADIEQKRLSAIVKKNIIPLDSTAHVRVTYFYQITKL